MNPRRVDLRIIKFSLLLAFAITLVLWLPASAQDTERVQELRGSINNLGEARGYRLNNLEGGRTLYVYVEATSGNLDPFTGLLSSDFQPGSLSAQFQSEVDLAISQNRDPLLVVPSLANENFYAWDDDSGGGFSAAFEFVVPSSGDYLLAVFSSPFNPSTGDFKLLVGLDAPQVLTGKALAQGEPLAVSTTTFERERAAVQVIQDALTETAPQRVYNLSPFKTGESLYVSIETTSGELLPQVVLKAYATKPVRSANMGGREKRASFEYKFQDDESAYILEVSGVEGSLGDYRMQVSRNVPEILDRVVTPMGDAVIATPIDVAIGAKLQQISNIDQKAERYEAVYSIRMDWQDPALAFRPDDCQCEFQIYTAKDFIAFATAQEIHWPAFTILNQQNNRWIQNDYVVVFPDGRATYFERFTTNLQAPDFDFRHFPFDTQQFFIRIDSLYGTRFIKFTPSDFSEVGAQLGEEEWFVIDHETEVVEEASSLGNVTSNFVFRFFAKRHLSFYIFRIFLPLVLIITVAWITFFLENYNKRVDATTANLLLFIAFNFTIANDLPRLGYLTFMDALLVGTFLISVIVVAYNVYLSRMEKLGRDTWAKRIDKYMIWLYPLAYIVTFGLIAWNFLLGS